MHSEKERNKPPYNSLKKYLGVNLTKGKDLLLSPRPKPPTVRSCPRTAPEGRDPAGGARAAASQPGESGGRRCLGCAPHPAPRGSNAAVVAKSAVAGGAARAAAREPGRRATLGAPPSLRDPRMRSGGSGSTEKPPFLGCVKPCPWA